MHGHAERERWRVWKRSIACRATLGSDDDFSNSHNDLVYSSVLPRLHIIITFLRRLSTSIIPRILHTRWTFHLMSYDKVPLDVPTSPTPWDPMSEYGAKVASNLLYPQYGTSSSSSNDHVTAVSPTETRVTTTTFIVSPFRWFILAQYSLMSMVNACNKTLFISRGMWIMYAPISDKMSSYFNVSSLGIDMFSVIYMIFIPASTISIIVIARPNGLRLSFIISTSLSLAGCLVKLLPDGGSSYAFAFVGQVLCAFGQGFFLGAPPILAATWFGDNERGNATAICFMANGFGSAFSFVFSPAIVTLAVDIWKLNLFYSFLSLLSLIVIVCFFKNAPLHPPSLSAALTVSSKSSHMTFSILLKNIVNLAELPFLFVCLSTGMALSILWAIGTTIGEMLVPRFTDLQAGWAGFSMIVAGLLSQSLAGLALDYTKAYGRIFSLCLLGAAIANLCFTFIISLSSHYVLVILSAIMFGGFVGAVSVVAMETSAEITYPAPEQIIGNIILSTAGFFAVINLFLIKWNVAESGNPLIVTVILSIILTIFSIISLVYFRPTLRRLNLAAVDTACTPTSPSGDLRADSSAFL